MQPERGHLDFFDFVPLCRHPERGQFGPYSFFLDVLRGFHGRKSSEGQLSAGSLPQCINDPCDLNVSPSALAAQLWFQDMGLQVLLPTNFEVGPLRWAPQAPLSILPLRLVGRCFRRQSSFRRPGSLENPFRPTAHRQSQCCPCSSAAHAPAFSSSKASKEGRQPPPARAPRKRATLPRSSSPARGTCTLVRREDCQSSSPSTSPPPWHTSSPPATHPRTWSWTWTILTDWMSPSTMTITSRLLQMVHLPSTTPTGTLAPLEPPSLPNRSVPPHTVERPRPLDRAPLPLQSFSSPPPVITASTTYQYDPSAATTLVCNFEDLMVLVERFFCTVHTIHRTAERCTAVGPRPSLPCRAPPTILRSLPPPLRGQSLGPHSVSLLRHLGGIGGPPVRWRSSPACQAS